MTVRVLKACPVTGAVLVYVYRPPRWLPSCSAAMCRTFCKARGYTPGDAESMLAQLLPAALPREDFPHEIGVSLGYPLVMSSASF